MSKDIPTKYRNKYKIGNLKCHDGGVDGLIIRNDGKSLAYQCKFRTNRAKPTYEELTKFWSDGRYCDYCCTVANCYSISDLSDKHEQNLKILVNEFDNLDLIFFNELYQLTNKTQKTTKDFHTPHVYQEKIVNDVITHFSIENRGKIIAACGTGKTLISLWIAERMECDNVLFLAPSIALIKQTLETWAAQAKIPFSFLCVCSDNTVSNNIDDDDADISISQLGIPVTTDETEIIQFLSEENGKRKYIFSTYQSADKIANAQLNVPITFDLIIFDEAHKTAGLRSIFSLALEDQYIRSKKRLFMTATERMVRPMLLRRAQENGEVIFSMDDENTYGPLFSEYNFGAAIADKTISDYKIVIAGVKESEVYNYIANNTTLSVKDINEENKISTGQSLYAKILLAKSLSEFSIKKVISFHSTIQKAKDFIVEQGTNISLKSIIKEFNQHIDSNSIFIDNINCQIDSGKRSEILNTFKEKDYSIISNAKCLTEGVDVPIIDSVYFVDRKNSLIDIVQACGRALRVTKGVDKIAYFIIPILIPEATVATDILYSKEFESVYNIIQALRCQDNRLADWINGLNQKYVQGKTIGGDEKYNSPIIVDINGVDIQQFSEELYVKIATVNADLKDLNKSQIQYGRGDRKAGQARLFKTIGDFTFNSYMHNLVIPTIAIYNSKKEKILNRTNLFFNNNNISHTLKLGLISKECKGQYILTPLGEYYLNKKIDDKLLFTRQMLRYSCSVEDCHIDRILFPYRACLRILSGIGSNKCISFYEFAFCIYPLFDSSKESIKRAIEDIHYLRANYPRLQNINSTNEASILSELNTYFLTQFSETDIWGKRPTTVKNQYIYFRNHLSLFDDIIEIKDTTIYMKPDCEAKVNRLLEMDQIMEELDRHTLLAKYTEVF